MAMSDMRKTIFGHSTPMGELPRGRAKTLRYGFRPQTRKADAQPDVELYDRYVSLCHDTGGTVDAGALYWTPLRLTAVVNGMLRRIERAAWKGKPLPTVEPTGRKRTKREPIKEPKHYKNQKSPTIDYYNQRYDDNDPAPF